jgi:PAS domain-containing protein
MSTSALHHQHNQKVRSQPSTHIVQFYEKDDFLVESVARFLDPTLAAGGAALVVATEAHRDALADELRARGFDLDRAVLEGRFVALDAAATLDTFMVEGWPEETGCKQVLSALLEKVTRASDGKGLAVFGEMVALLWGDEKREAAVRLEQIWNQLAETHLFALFCAYPMAGFDQEKHRKLFFNICGEHSEVNPTEDYPGHGSESQRRRKVAHLQQKTRALANEIQLSQERILLLQNAAGVGTWEMDLLDETLSFSSKAAGMLKLHAGTIPLSQFVQIMPYSGDRDRLLASLKRARTGRKEFVTEFRTSVGPETRVFSIRGKTAYNDGQPLVLGVLSDVTPGG